MSRPPSTEPATTEQDRTKPIDRRLFGVTGGVHRYLGVTIGLGLASAIAVIIGATLLAAVVNRIFLGDAVVGDLVGMLVALGLVYVARGVFEWGRSVAAFRAAAGVKRTLREQVMRAVLVQTAQGRAPSGSGDLALTATTGIDSLDAYFARYVPQLVLGALIPLVAAAWIVTVDPLTTVIIIVTVPLIPVFMMLIGNYADRATRARWRTIRSLGDGLVETLRGLLTLEVYRASEGRLDRFRRLSDEYRKQTMATLRIAFLSAFVLELVATMSVAVIAVAVGIRVVQGSLDFEPALAVLILAPEVYIPLRKAGTEFHAAMDGMEAARSVFAVLEAAPVDDSSIVVDEASIPVRGAPHIDFAAVSYRYPSLSGSGSVVLDGVDFSIDRGEHVAVIGPSGAGKSTLIRLILGFDRPGEGEVSIEGVPLSRMDLAAWRSEIGWVHQEPFLIAGTVLDNVRLGAPGVDADESAAALDLVGAGDLIPRLCEVVGERGAGLSHGERRMITLARAILRDPALLLLDEPTAGIDSETQLRIAESFERFAADRTVLTVAHQRVLVDLADRVIVIDDGRIIVPAAGEQ
ncbi:MAG: thiol reductant ABC exporter subunit CydD [Actinomycetota bacterium]|nr:thiol reductant ABC exporter subunit CydD [Actinomycetota bacterium]